MYFVETRGNDGKKPQRVTFSEAILNPNASFGGIYAPEKLPLFDTSFIEKHLSSSYIDLAYDILKSFKVDIDEETIKGALDRYRGFDDPTNPTHLRR